MAIEVRKLTPNLAEDYVRFFDETPHDNNIDEHKCYCVGWCSENSESRDFSSREKRKDIALQYVKEGKIQGYLAYCGDEIVGWCNANTKSYCLSCDGWRRFMEYVPVEEQAIKVKSIFCFVVAPKMWRKGIATQFLERICQDAARDGFSFVEAYPYKGDSWQTSNFGGYYEMYTRAGFSLLCETEQGVVVRKQL